jgi:hypothetical protein
LRLGIVIFLIVLGIVANIVVMLGLWPLRQGQGSSSPVPRFSRAPPPVLDSLLGATTIAAFLLAVLTGVSQLPVLAFGKLPLVLRYGHTCTIPKLFCCKVRKLPSDLSYVTFILGRPM